MLFCTSNTKHLAPFLPFTQGSYFHKYFSDGEQYVKLEQSVDGQTVWVIAATNAPADHLVELFLLLNVLERGGATINLLITYFGYARQDRPLENEASSAQMIGGMLKLFAIKKIMVIHAHSALLHNYLNFVNVIPSDLICQSANLYDAIAAPDQGAHELVKALGTTCKIEALLLSKIRHEQELVQILEYDGIVKARKVLIIDDIIATGNTIIEVAKTLEKLGADHISVWATHGIFSNHAQQAIQASTIKKVYVTNSLPQKIESDKIEIINIAPCIEQILMFKDEPKRIKK